MVAFRPHLTIKDFLGHMLIPPNCPFLLYSVISSYSLHISKPSFPRECSLLFAYGGAGQNATGWTRIQAEPYTQGYETVEGRRTSRILKLNSRLLNIRQPTVYMDTKRRIKNMKRVETLIDQMKRCNASMLSYLHPDRPHSIVDELHAILRFRRTSNRSQVVAQERFVRGHDSLARMDALKNTTINDGSMLVRIQTPELEAFEREWYRVYMTGSDRDQPAFGIAYANMFGNRPSHLCGNSIWVIPHKGLKDRKMLGHVSFS